jgi:hypothetical protein
VASEMFISRFLPGPGVTPPSMTIASNPPHCSTLSKSGLAPASGSQIRPWPGRDMRNWGVISGAVRLPAQWCRTIRPTRPDAPTSKTRMRLAAGVDIFIADDVIFAQITACLHLYQGEGQFAGVFQTVHSAQRDIDRLVF